VSDQDSSAAPRTVSGPPATPFGPDGHPRKWAILGVLVVSLLIVVLDSTILNVGLPTIQRDLGATQSQLVWAIDAYILVFAALLFTCGVLGDRFGRKRILVIGLAIFALSSFIAAFAQTPGQLIALRAVMGIGGAAVTPVTLAIITVVFPPRERGRAIGLWAAAVGGAVVLGPVLGGILLQNPGLTSWLTQNDFGGIFLVNVPIALVGIIGVLRIVPETKNEHAASLDFVGLGLSIVGLTVLIYGIIHAGEIKDWTAASVVGSILAGIAILALFVFYESRSEHKSFDITLFSNRGFTVSLIAVTLAFFALSGITFTLPFYLQAVREFSVLAAGLCFLPFAIGQLLAAPRSAAMVARFGAHIVVTLGLALVALALGALAVIKVDTPIWMVLVVFFAFGFGMGNVIAPASTIIQNVLPMDRVGAGSAVQNTVRQVGGALGVAIVGTLLAQRYAELVAPVVAPLPAPAAEAISGSVAAVRPVLDSLGSAVSPAQSDAIASGAFEAFVTASHATSLMSAISLIIAAVIVAVWLPRNIGGRNGIPSGHDAVGHSPAAAGATE